MQTFKEFLVWTCSFGGVFDSHSSRIFLTSPKNKSHSGLSWDMPGTYILWLLMPNVGEYLSCSSCPSSTNVWYAHASGKNCVAENKHFMKISLDFSISNVLWACLRNELHDGFIFLSRSPNINCQVALSWDTPGRNFGGTNYFYFWRGRRSLMKFFPESVNTKCWFHQYLFRGCLRKELYGELDYPRPDTVKKISHTVLSP